MFIVGKLGILDKVDIPIPHLVKEADWGVEELAQNEFGEIDLTIVLPKATLVSAPCL